MTFCLKLIQGQATLSVSLSIKQQPKNSDNGNKYHKNTYTLGSLYGQGNMGTKYQIIILNE